jgi:hypothetical protein
MLIQDIVNTLPDPNKWDYEYNGYYFNVRETDRALATLSPGSTPHIMPQMKIIQFKLVRLTSGGLGWDLVI